MIAGRAARSPVEINGWRVYAHPLFLDQLEALITEVDILRRKDPQGYSSKNASKRLASIAHLMLQDIPQNPSRKEFHQYRLFFRFHARSRLIVLGWVNDTDTKRAYGSKRDAYRVFNPCWPAAIRQTIGMNSCKKRSRPQDICTSSAIGFLSQS